MIDAELQARARRLLAGPPRADDLDHLFLNQRDRAHGRGSFREIGDFVAHRGERSKGPVTQRVRDIFTSFQVWSLGLRGRVPTLADLRAAGAANLRLLTDEHLETRIGMRREAAKTKLEKGFRKLEAKRLLSVHEERLLTQLANHFIWRPAFTDDDLVRDFTDVLVLNGVVPREEENRIGGLKGILALYAISRMHGAAITLEDGRGAILHAGFANKDRLLEVKVDLGYTDWIKPVQAPICIFLTSMMPEGHCDPSIIVDGTPVWNAWSGPLELRQDGLLAAMA